MIFMLLFCLFKYSFLFIVLGREPRILGLVRQCTITELHALSKEEGCVLKRKIISYLVNQTENP